MSAWEFLRYDIAPWSQCLAVGSFKIVKRTCSIRNALFLEIYKRITRPVPADGKPRLTLTRVLQTGTEVQISAGRNNRNVEKYVRISGCGRFRA
jgi:hypothetical protein